MSISRFPSRHSFLLHSPIQSIPPATFAVAVCSRPPSPSPCPAGHLLNPILQTHCGNWQNICRECFYAVFEDEVHTVIVENQLFKAGERIAIGASGGNDSTILAYVLSELNRRHNYGLDIFLLSVDEGITGYRDDSLETVKTNKVQYGLPLKVVSYKDLYGWTMDEIAKMIGLKNNCTFCSVFRRQALDRRAALLKVDKLITRHNANDMAEIVLLNILRGILPDDTTQGPSDSASSTSVLQSFVDFAK